MMAIADHQPLTTARHVNSWPRTPDHSKMMADDGYWGWQLREALRPPPKTAPAFFFKVASVTHIPTASVCQQCSPLGVNRDHMPPMFATGPQPTTNASGRRRCALPPNPPGFVTLRLPPLAARLLPRTLQKKHNKCKDTQCIYPPPAFFLRLPPLTSTLLPIASNNTTKKNTRRSKKNTEEKQQKAKPSNASGGRRCALPLNPLQL